MGLTNGILTAPFTKIALNGQGDLQNALGRTTCMSEIQLVADIDVDSAAVGAIKKFAKFKPFRSSTVVYPFDPSQSTPELRSPERTTDRVAANYGLTAPATKTDVAQVFGQEWVYNAPVSGTDPLRALDFDGYDTNAAAPARSPGDITIYRAYQSRYIFTDIVRGGSSAYAIGLEDLVGLKEYYLCVAFSTTADFTGTVIYKTSSAKIKDLSSALEQIEVTSADLNTLDNGGFKYYLLCGATTQKTSLTAASYSTPFIALPADAASDMTGQFNQDTTIARVSASAYSQTANPASDSNFNISPRTVMTCPPYYCHIKATVTAYDAHAVTLTESNLSLSIRGTFHGAGVTVNNLTAQLYDSTFTRKTSISIAAGATTTVYLVIPTQILALNASGAYVAPTTGQRLTSTITVQHSGYLFGAFRVEAQN